MDIINPYIHGGEALTFDGFGNRSRSFDGVDDYVDLGDSDDFSFGDGNNDSPFSVSAWVKMENHIKFRLISKYKDQTPDAREWLFSTDVSGRLMLFLSDNNNGGNINGRYSDATTMASYVGQWIHVVATYDGSGSDSGIKLYINASRVDDISPSSGNYTSMVNTGEPCRIGTTTISIGQDYAEGNIADVRLYDAELSSSDVSDLYAGTNVTTNLIGHWLTDEDNVLDNAGSNNGTNYGSKYSYDNPSPPVEFGRASRIFNGTSDYVDLGNDASLDLNSTLTMSFWIKPESSHNGAILSKWTSGLSTVFTNAYTCYFGQDAGNRRLKFRVQQSNGTKIALSDSTDLPLSQWSHVVCKADGSNLSVFIDGQSSSSVSYDGTIDVDPVKLLIGKLRQSDSIYTFDGKIADVRLYDTDLTASQISDLYSGTDVQTNLIGHWLTDNDDVEDKAGTNDGTNFGSTYSDDNPPMDLIPFGQKSRTFSSDYINTNTGFQSVFQSSFSISTWIRFDDGVPSSSKMIFGNQSTPPVNRVMSFLDSSGGLTFSYFCNDIQARAEIDQNFSNGDTGWFHYTVVVEPTGITVYKDGSVQTLDATDDGDMSAVTMGDFGINLDFYIGARNLQGNADLQMNGNIADFRIYDSALSASDVINIYNRTDDKSNIHAWYITNSDDVLDHAGTNDGTNNGSTYSSNFPS